MFCSERYQFMGTAVFVFQAKTEQIPVETEQNVTDENGNYNDTISTYLLS